MEWQPINTAPKDGTPILACVVGFVPAVARWETIPDEFTSRAVAGNVSFSCWRIREAEEFESDDDWFSDWCGSSYEPSHWMPLPEPPKG